MVDCGRRYFSVTELNQIIDAASENGMHYVMLAFGNDGLRFLLDDMSIKAGDNSYYSNNVKTAIHNGNVAYDKAAGYSPASDELTQYEMDQVLKHAGEQGVEIIPLLNNPGHMHTVISAMKELGMSDFTFKCTSGTSSSTVDVTNADAIAFVQALVKKYVNYFSQRGCHFFNMGADEYGNDIVNGSGDPTPRFNELLNQGGYGKYVAHLNAVAGIIESYGMTPMAFNDGIYYNYSQTAGKYTIDRNIIVCYWSGGWGDYTVASATNLNNAGFSLINTNGDYYWILGKNDKYDSDVTAGKGFSCTEFSGSTINNPVGAMFCVWCDYPGRETLNMASITGAIPYFAQQLPARDDMIYSHANVVVGSAITPVDQVIEPEPSETPDPSDTDAKYKETVNLVIGQTSDPYTYDGEETPVTADETIAKANVTQGSSLVTSISAGTYYVATSADAKPTLQITIEQNDGDYYLKTGDTYVYPNATRSQSTWKYSLNSASYNWYYFSKPVTIDTTGDGGFWIYRSVSSGRNKTTAYLTIKNGEFNATSDATTLYLYKEATTQSTVSFTGIKAGTTTCKVGDTLYTINVSRKAQTINVLVNGTTTINVTGTPDFEKFDKAFADYSYDETTGVVTISGLAEGKTTFTDDTTEYTIEVTTENLENVDPITFEFWVTNCKVTALDKDGGAHGESIAISAANVHFETGVATKDLMYEDGYRTTDSEKAPHVFWKTTRLTEDKKQTLDKGDNKTTSGNDFTYIRYWNGKWAFSNDQINWTEINDTDQIVAYYLLQLTVTDEVTTQVTDWGVVPHNNFNSSDFVLMDFAVKYESSGVRTPNTFPQSDKTVAFHCDSGDSVTVHYDSTKSSYYRDLGMVRGVETKDYEVYMITVTPSKSAITRSYSTYIANAYTYDYDESTGEAASEKVVWVDDEANLPAEFRDTSTHYTSISGKYNYSVGGEAIVPGVEIYNTYGMLITYYVRAKATPDSLKVVYINKNNNEKFYSYNIAVKQGTTFVDVQLPETEIDGVSALTNGRVENLQGNYEYVSSDLSTMPAIGAEFRYGGYECVQVTESEDHKTVTLYYTFNYNKTFVVDFGLPLIIEPGNVNDKLNGANITKVEIAKVPTSGTATVEAKNVRYKLNEMLAREDSMTIKYTGTNVNNGNEGNVSYNISIIPATNVYYEDSFVKFNPGTGAAAVKWSTEGTTTEATQSLSTLDSKDVYGYDKAYENSTAFSMGSARKVTVTSNMAGNWADGSTWPTATFTFKGTGFDIISLTDNTSGSITVKVYAGEKAEGNPVRNKFVNDYFGYEYKDGKWSKSTTADGNNALYQIPVMKITGLDYGQYTVVVTVFYDELFNSTGTEECSFWFDAVRVYNPLGEDTSRYEDAKEGYPQYIKLRDKVASGAAGVNDKLLFIDGAAAATVEQYTNLGPNNEVYLAKGQAISFKLKSTDNIASVQIGAKAPANIGAANMVVSGTANTANITKEIKTATEMYYEITDVAKNGDLVTITNEGDAILSLTNIKITYEADNTTDFAALTDSDAKEAVAAVRALFAAHVDPEPTEPDEPEKKPFEPELKWEWSKNVRKGGRAILTVKTSTDVDYILVDGVKYDKYITRTERNGRGWNAPRVTYREFIYMMPVNESGLVKIPVIAGSYELGVSEPVETTLNVKASSPIRDWIGGLFGRWF